MSGVTRQQVEQSLLAAWGALAPGESLAVIDESHLHAGHAGAGEGSHWRVRVCLTRMAGLRPVARHRLVYDALRPLIDRGGIHALAIEASAPAGR